MTTDTTERGLERFLCTHVKGKASWFLPFNRSWNDGAGKRYLIQHSAVRPVRWWSPTASSGWREENTELLLDVFL